MLEETLKWRKEYKPDFITANDVKGELNNNGKMYRNGVDKRGCPIIYMKPRHDNTGAEKRVEKVRYLVYILEKAIASMQEDVEKMSIIVDFKDSKSGCSCQREGV